jgi:hypothetical protein
MKQIFLLMALLALSINIQGDQQNDVTAAKSAIKEFAGALQSELKAAMQAGGPVAAIGVCNTRAAPIAEQVSAAHGMNLSRVSLRNRNTGNKPNQWQAAVLGDFEASKAAGEDVSSLAWSGTAAVDGSREFRFMKAIPTGGICLTCHGREIAPEIKQQLHALYPEDLATGFSEGDIRGAFVVTKQLD